MHVPKSGEIAGPDPVRIAGGFADRWNAVAVVVTLMTVTLAALVHLVLRAAGS